MNDMYADAVLAVILQVESNPTTAQGNCYCDATTLSHTSFFMGFSRPFRQYGGHFEFYCFK